MRSRPVIETRTKNGEGPGSAAKKVKRKWLPYKEFRKLQRGQKDGQTNQQKKGAARTVTLKPARAT